MFAQQTSLNCVRVEREVWKYFIFEPLRSHPGRKRLGSRETKGIMVAVGWAWQEEEGYEVVGHVTGYPTACFRKLSDEIRGSSWQYSLCFSPRLLVFFLRKSEFSLYTPSLPFGGSFLIFLLSSELPRGSSSAVALLPTEAWTSNPIRKWRRGGDVE